MNVNELFFARMALGLRLLPVEQQRTFLERWVEMYDDLVRQYRRAIDLDHFAPPPPAEFAEQHADWLDIVQEAYNDALELSALGRLELGRCQRIEAAASAGGGGRRKQAARRAKSSSSA